jgi:hypothetical protein
LEPGVGLNELRGSVREGEGGLVEWGHDALPAHSSAASAMRRTARIGEPVVICFNSLMVYERISPRLLSITMRPKTVCLNA